MARFDRMGNHYQAFGKLSVRRGDGKASDVAGRQASVLAILLTEADQVVSADRVIDEVWGESAPKDPEAALYSVISRLRSLVGDDLVTSPGGYSLNPGSVDLAMFETAADKARQTGRPADFEHALALWTGEPFAGMDDIPAVRLEVERLRLLHRRIQLELLEGLLKSGGANEAADRARLMVGTDPLNEQALDLYMRALYHSGRKREALQAFRRYEGLLAEETGLEPSASLRELEFGILVDELDTPPAESRAPATIDLAITFVERAPAERVAVGRAGAGSQILVHPGWLSKLDWIASGVDMRSPLWSRLAKTHEVIIFDRFGTGLSEGRPSDFSFRSAVDELKTILRKTCSGPVPVWAASGAGPIAIQAAYEEPEIISHLLLYATYASGPATFPPEVGNSMAALIRASWTMGSDVLANLLFPSGSVENRQIWARAAKDLATPKIAEELLREMYSADVAPILEDITQPSLVMHYKGDKAVPVSGGMHLARSIPGAQLVTLEGTTHYPLPGEELRVVEAVDRFLAATAE